MGSSQSQKLSLVNDIVNKNVRNITSSKQSNTKLSASVQMLQSIKLSNVDCEGGLIISQDSAIEFNVVEEFSDTDTTALQQAITEALDNEMASGQESEVELGAIGFSDQNVQQSIRNRIRNILETNVTKEVINNTVVTANVDMTQNLLVESARATGDCEFRQNSLVEASVEKLTTLITDLIIEDELLTEIVTQQEAEQKAKMTGFATIIDSVADFLSGPFLIFLIIVVVLLFFLPITGGIVGGGKGAAGMLLFVLFGVGIYLLIDYLVFSPESSVTKYPSVEVVAPEEVQKHCGSIWYSPDAQSMLKDLNDLEQNEDYTEEELLFEKSQYLTKLARADICGEQKGRYGKKAKAYDELYTCLAKNDLIDPDTMSTVNIITGATSEEYSKGQFSNSRAKQYRQAFCDSKECSSCKA